MNSDGKLLITAVKNNTVSVLLDSSGRAVQMNAYSPAEKSMIGNIYIGRTANIIPSLKAAFIECPGKINGYLNMKELKPDQHLHPGNKIAVQVNNDSIKGKNPSLTTKISLVGKYSILMAHDPGLNFSEKFKDQGKKHAIQQKYTEFSYDDTGFIIRTNALYTDPETVISEIKRLHEKWDRIQRSASEAVYISEIYTAPSDYLQDIRDTYDSLYDSIITDNADIYDRCHEYLSVFQPQDLDKLKYHDNSIQPLSVVYNLRKIFLNALSTKVWLRSGAYIFIEPTQALTAVDVNTGKYISDKNPETEFLKINQEAAAEIARQIRIRNLSGIIIIDFINMKDENNKKLLLDYLKSQLKFDPVKTNIIEMTKLDLVEITRSKIRKPIYEILDISMLQ